MLALYILFLVVIKDSDIIKNNYKDGIEADAYFYTEMNPKYFNKTK